MMWWLWYLKGDDFEMVFAIWKGKRKWYIPSKKLTVNRSDLFWTFNKLLYRLNENMVKNKLVKEKVNVSYLKLIDGGKK